MTESRIRAAAQPLAQYLVAVFDLDEELAIESAIKITERQLEAEDAWLVQQGLKPPFVQALEFHLRVPTGAL